MKDEIINNYLIFRKNFQGSIKKNIYATWRKYGILLIFAIITWIIAAFLINKITLPDWADLITTGGVALIELVCFNLMQRKDINTSEGNIYYLHLYYREVEKWLATIGYKNKSQIERLHDRYKEKITTTKDQMLNIRNSIDKVMSFFVIPVYVAIINSVLGSNVDFEIEVDNISKDIIIILAIYFIAVIVAKMMEPIIFDSYNTEVRLVEDLEGVIDIRFLSETQDLTHNIESCIQNDVAEEKTENLEVQKKI